MRPFRLSFRSTLAPALVGLVGLATVLLPSPPASAAGPRPTVKFVSPVCVNGTGVSFNGTVNWKTSPPGTTTVNWGDGDTALSSFPDWHVYPAAGTYIVTLTATDSHGSGTASTTVTVGPSDATCLYTVSPQPIAEGGTLSALQTAPVVVKVTNPAGKPVPKSVPVWLSFDPAPGGGTAIACCSATGTTVPLATTPNAFTTGFDQPPGEVAVTYTSSASPPDTGSDVITASGVPTPGVGAPASTSYQYSSSPVLFTPPPTIPDDCSVDVSRTLGPWLRDLPSNSTVEPPPGACYQVDEGLSLNFPVGLTINGGTYEDDSATPGNSGGGGTPRGSPVFNVLGGSAVTFNALTIDGANSLGGYTAKMAFAGGIELQGTIGATISDVDITDTFGDGITLDPLRNGSDHKGSGIVNASENVTIAGVSITQPGRMGISFVSVNGASVSDVAVSNVGLDTFDVEADQGNEGTENLTINGCTASSAGAGDFFANGGAGSGKSTGNITVSNCTETQPQAGTAVMVDRPTGTNLRGPIVFDDDTFACGASTSVTCVITDGATVTIENSTLDFPGTLPAENVYDATMGSILSFIDDDVTGYGSLGTYDSTTPPPTISGGTWTPAS
jgi:hypothetical protein